MTAVDSNVLIYYLDQYEPVKQAKAIALLNRLRLSPTPNVLLWQALAESIRQLRRWQDGGRITRQELLKYAGFFRSLFPLTLPTELVLDNALDLTGRFSLSHWDSMMLGACKEAGVTTLYTEDMGAPMVYDGIQLINPFV